MSFSPSVWQLLRYRRVSISENAVMTCAPLIVFFKSTLCFMDSLRAPSRHTHSSTMSAEEIGTAFVTHFYQAFDSNVDSLSGLYVSASWSEEKAFRPRATLTRLRPTYAPLLCHRVC